MKLYLGNSFMKKLLLIFSLFVSFFATAQIEKVIPSRPSGQPKLVNDLTKSFLTQQQLDALEQKLYKYDDSTSNQIAIVIVENLDGYSPVEYATELGRKWGVGNKEFNNGIVVLISTGGGQGNRKAAIAVGYGLEGAVTDLTTKAIIDNNLIPNFKEKNYYRGLDEATDNIIKAAEGRYQAPANYGSKKKKGIGISTIIIIIIILIIIFSGAGPGTGTYVSRGGFGGWTGGSGWSGGGSSGGGFGGFGGGSFGGGGSSGSW